MKRALLAISVLGAFGAAQQAPPGIGQNGVVNTASQIAPTLPGGAIAQGALFTIYGVRLGAPGHTFVTIWRNGAAMAAEVLSARPQRIDARMPLSAPLGTAELVVTVGGQASRPFRTEVVEFNPGIFSRNGEGWGPARSANSTANPAHPSQRATLIVTGLANAKEVTVIVGNRATKAGPPRHTAKPGEDEIAFTIPPDAPQGCYVPVYLRAAPGRASNVVTMSIRSGSGPCDPGPVPLLTSERIAVAGLSRTRMKARRKNVADAVIDDARIQFKATASEPVLSPVRLLPPLGTCTGYTSSFQSTTVLSSSISSIIGPEGRGLDAGPSLTLSREGGAKSIGQSYGNPGNYRAHLGSAGVLKPRGAPPLFLEPGRYVLQGRGGKEAGPFRIAFTVPAPFDWIDRDQISTVDRSRGVTLHWRGVARDQTMLIVARNIDQITTAIGMCLCLARGAAGQFTIPPDLLANVPISRDRPGTAYDELVIGSLPAKAVPFKVQGLNGGFVSSVYATGRIVEYR